MVIVFSQACDHHKGTMIDDALFLCVLTSSSWTAFIRNTALLR